MTSHTDPHRFGVRRRATNFGKDRRRHRPALEPLDGRVLLSVSSPGGPVLGSDGAVQPADFDSSTHQGMVAPLGTVGAGSSSVIGYTPIQVQHAYGFDQIPLKGASTTIAIIDPAHDPNAFSDLQQFDRHVQGQVISDPPPGGFIQVNECGQGFDYPANQDASLSYETSLDVQWAHAVAPDASILLVEFNATPTGGGRFNFSSQDVLNAINTARDWPGVVAVSMSLSLPGLSDSNFTTPAGHNGVTFVASSGDSGGLATAPATSPRVLSVGGTVLPLDPAGDYPGTGPSGEIGWADSSGGLSNVAQPPYQKGIVTQSTTARAVPDVAYNAGDGVAVYDSWASPSAPWFSLTGTSAGALNGPP